MNIFLPANPVRFLWLFVMVVLVNTAFAQAKDRVVPNKERTTILDATDKYLMEPWVVDAKTVAEKTNPFGEIVAAPTSTEAQQVSTTEKAPPPAPVRYTDEDALQIIARSLTPSGSLIMGERKFLNLEGGRRLSLGDPIRINVRGEEYTAKIADITSGTYTLSMNDASLTVNFSKAVSSGSIQRTE